MSYPDDITNGSKLFVFVTEQSPIVPDDIYRILDCLLKFSMFIFATLGVATNIINVRVFFHQGLSSDSSTVGLFSLAIADFLSCILLAPSPVCEILRYTNGLIMSYNCSSWFAVIFPIPHIAMSRLACWITVYIAIERCLCVLLPFKVKSIVTPKVTSVVMILMYILTFCIYIPLILNTEIQRLHHQGLNSTVDVYSENELGKAIAQYMAFIFNTVVSTIAIIIIAFATALMLYTLNRTRKWRDNTVSSGKSTSAKKDISVDKKSQSAQGKKDIDTLKMVLIVTGVFLVCLSMGHFPGFAAALLPGFSPSGFNKNLFFILNWYKFIFNLINSSLNFFFYVRISSRYKAAYNEAFKKKMINK